MNIFIDYIILVRQVVQWYLLCSQLANHVSHLFSWGAKSLKNGLNLTWSSILFICVFSFTSTLTTNNWRVRSAGNIVKKKCPFQCLHPIFLKNVKKFFSSIPQWVGQAVNKCIPDTGIFSLFFPIFSSLIPQKKKKNPTKINGFVEISLLVGDRQAQILSRILDILFYLPAHRAPL